jgi:hypothetical protein
MRFAASRGIRMSRHTWKQNITTIMQPFHCDLQPNSKTPYNYLRTREQPHIAEHQGRTDSRLEPPQPQPPHTHTRYPTLPAAATEKHRVSCSGFLPKTNPMQHSRSHCNAFCSSRCTFMQPIHGDLHPRVAEQQGRTNHTPKHTVRNRRTDKVPFIAACSHFTRKNTRLRAPKQSPCNRHAAITVTTSQGHHFPRSTLLLVTTS